MIASTKRGFDVLSLDFEGWRPLADTGSCTPHPPGKTAVTRLTLTVDEAALMLGGSRAAAYRCVKRGELRGVQLGRRIVIPVAAVDELLHASAPPAATSAIVTMTRRRRWRVLNRVLKSWPRVRPGDTTETGGETKEQVRPLE